MTVLAPPLLRWIAAATPRAERAIAQPAPRGRGSPVLMGDILSHRNGRPELLIRWEEERARGTRDQKVW